MPSEAAATEPPDVLLERDISKWHSREVAENPAGVPDFWDDCDTSFRLAQFLASLGYVRAESNAK